MITLQHSALYFLALGATSSGVTVNIGRNNIGTKLDTLMAEFEKKIPWVLLPDGIRAYIGPRQASHFEETPDQTDVSWMIFPDKSTLKTLTVDNAKNVIKHHVPAEKYPRSVIGEQTQIDEFDARNWAHPQYEAIRAHLVQDYVLDNILRDICIDPKGRFKDSFTIRHNGEVIDGAELRAQIALFEKFGFIKLVGAVYNRTGILLNRDWFDAHVWKALEATYPADLAAKTYSFMKIDDGLNDRINRKEFVLTDDEKKSVKITKDLDSVLNQLYSVAYLATKSVK